MKIEKHSLINIVENPDFIKHHVNFLDNVKMNDIKHLSFYEMKKQFFNTTKFRKLVVCDTVSGDISKIKLPKINWFDFFRFIPNRTDSILIRNVLYRYIKTDSGVICCMENIINDSVHSRFFYFDLINDKMIIVDFFKDKEIFNFMVENFMMLITYLELTKTNTVIVKGGNTHGNIIQGKFENKSNNDIIFVKRNWNTKTILLKDIHVSGHWRLQPCGKNRSEYKVIFIKPYKKGITRIKPKKDLHTQTLN